MAHVFEKKWRSEDVRLRENVDFSALLLSERVLEGLKNAGFKKPSPIQLESIPMGRFGKDLMVQAKSGTGKTLVFVIVALEMLKRKLFRPQVLVIVPTREIATQICSVVQAVGSTFPRLACSSFIGGLPLFEDKEKAVMSQIVVGTPGRLKQLIQLKALPTNSIRLLVIDEADELLEGESFKEDIEDIFKSLPDDKQVIATSATFNPRTKKALHRYLSDPHLVRLNAKELALLGMVHYAAVVDFCPMPVLQYNFKLEVLEKVLKTVKFSQCLLFCNGIQRVEVLHKDLRKWGFSAAYISSAKEQCDRLKAIDRLKHFKCKVLVSSDVTARGIDAENVDLVINFDLSYRTEIYMHRVGRAGRYGSVGVAVSIITKNEIKHLHRIEKEGSFKTFKLPDPLPRDLILYPPEGDYVIDGSDQENVVCTNGEKPNSVECEELNNNGYKNLEEKVSTNVIQAKKCPVTSVDFEDSALSEQATTQPTPDDVKTYDDITLLAAECEIKVDADDYSKNKKIKSVHFNEVRTDRILQNGYANENGIKLDKIDDSDLLDGYDKSELISNGFSDKPCASDIHETPSDLCDQTEEQNVINDSIKGDAQLVNQLSNADDIVNENDLKIDGTKLSEVTVSDTVENKEDNCDQATVNISNNALNNVIKTFIDTYESKENRECVKSKVTFEGDSEVNESSGKKLITIDMINNLKSQKTEFFYNILKSFQEDKDKCSASFDNEKEGKQEKIDDNLNAPLQNESNSVLVTEEVENLVENPEIKNRKDFPEKPSFQSTPQITDKIKQENAKVTVTDEAVCKPMFQNKLTQLFQELSNESDSDDSVSNEVVRQSSSANDSSSSGSESGSSSRDSQEDSGSSSGCSNSDSSSGSSSSSSSSGDEDNEDNFPHNYFRTGRQNPSLVSDSSSNQFHHDQIRDRWFTNYKPQCSHATSHCMLQQSAVRSLRMPRGMCRGRRPRDRHHASSVPYNHEESTAYFEDISMPTDPGTSSRRISQSTRGREQSSADHTHSYSPRTHLRVCRSQNPSRGVTREEDPNRSENSIHQSSSSHSHSLDCYLPTEHRCHPNTPDYPCQQGVICEMWYDLFYNQWLHIQNVVY